MENLESGTSKDTGNSGLTSAQLRKIKKPIIEKKRRCRINESLTQLKSLILEALNKDESQYNKMEKADILELTVRHIKQIHNNLKNNGVDVKGSTGSPDSRFGSCSSMQDIVSEKPMLLSPAFTNTRGITVDNVTDNPQTVSSTRSTNPMYEDGFNKCMQEVSNFLNNCEDLRQEVKTDICQHLEQRIKNNPQPSLQSAQLHCDNNNAHLSNYVQILPREQVPSNPPVTQMIQSMPCLQPLQLANGQTIFVANAVPAMIQPHPIVQPHYVHDLTNPCPAVEKTDPGTVQVDPQPLQIITYNNVNYIPTNAHALISPTIITTPPEHDQHTAELNTQIVTANVDNSLQKTQVPNETLPNMDNKNILVTNLDTVTEKGIRGDNSALHIAGQFSVANETSTPRSSAQCNKPYPSTSKEDNLTQEEESIYQSDKRMVEKKSKGKSQIKGRNNKKSNVLTKQDTMHKQLSTLKSHIHPYSTVSKSSSTKSPRSGPSSSATDYVHNSQPPIANVSSGMRHLEELQNLRGAGPSQRHSQALQQVSPTSDKMWRPW